jgi:hypothetical protein
LKFLPESEIKVAIAALQSKDTTKEKHKWLNTWVKKALALNGGKLTQKYINCFLN